MTTHISGSLRRFVVTASSGGAVVNECLKHPSFRALVHSVVCDQTCGAAGESQRHGIPVEIFSEPNRDVFCDRLLDYLQRHGIDYVFSFYTKFSLEENPPSVRGSSGEPPSSSAARFQGQRCMGVRAGLRGTLRRQYGRIYPRAHG